MARAVDTESEAVREPKRRPLLVDLIIRLVREKPLGTFGGVIVILMFATGIFADFLAPYGMNDIDPMLRLVPPSAEHILGTDQLGRDVLSRVIHGARTSMIVGVTASALGVFIGLVGGMLCGYLGGKFDLVVQRFVDAWMCFPGLFIILTIMALVGPGLWQVIFVLGVSFGVRDTRVMRGAVIGIKENTYLDAARAVGCSTQRILTKHILPNIMPVVIIVYSTGLAGMIMMEAMVSFLGFGIPPPNPSWGNMLSGEGRQYMYEAPWLALWPGLALSIAVFGINMLGDALRDILDPRLRGGLGRYAGVKRKRPKLISETSD